MACNYLIITNANYVITIHKCTIKLLFTLKLTSANFNNLTAINDYWCFNIKCDRMTVSLLDFNIKLFYQELLGNGNIDRDNEIINNKVRKSTPSNINFTK